MEDEEIDLKETLKKFNDISVDTRILIAMFLLLLAMYLYHTNQIAECNAFFHNELLKYI